MNKLKFKKKAGNQEVPIQVHCLSDRTLEVDVLYLKTMLNNIISFDKSNLSKAWCNTVF